MNVNDKRGYSADKLACEHQDISYAISRPVLCELCSLLIALAPYPTGLEGDSVIHNGTDFLNAFWVITVIYDNCTSCIMDSNCIIELRNKDWRIIVLCTVWGSRRFIMPILKYQIWVFPLNFYLISSLDKTNPSELVQFSNYIALVISCGYLTLLAQTKAVLCRIKFDKSMQNIWIWPFPLQINDSFYKRFVVVALRMS